MGSECGELLQFGTSAWWINFGFAGLCVCGAATAAGLTMGMMSLDPMKIELAKEQGSPVERKWAGRVAPLIKRHHLLLVTLLLMNSAANEALPLFLDELVPSYVAIILSVSLVLLFGEIIPSAIFTGPRRLQLSAALTPLVWCFMFATFAISFPLAWLLDNASSPFPRLSATSSSAWLDFAPFLAATVLGTDHADRLSRRELRALVGLHAASVIRRGADARGSGGREGSDSNDDDSSSDGEGGSALEGLLDDEVKIIQGALDLKDKTAADALTPLDQTFMLSADSVLDNETMAELLAAGHSRVPVFDGERRNVRGLLLVKRLIVLDPEDARPIASLPLRPVVFVGPSAPLFGMLNQFQTGRSHMAFVVSDPESAARAVRRRRPLPAGVRVLGFLCLEDLLELLIQEDIDDEADLALQVMRRARSRGAAADTDADADADADAALAGGHADPALVESRVRGLHHVISAEVGVARAANKFRIMAARARARRLAIAQSVAPRAGGGAGAARGPQAGAVGPSAPLLDAPSANGGGGSASAADTADAGYGAVHHAPAAETGPRGGSYRRLDDLP